MAELVYTEGAGESLGVKILVRSHQRHQTVFSLLQENFFCHHLHRNIGYWLPSFICLLLIIIQLLLWAEGIFHLEISSKLVYLIKIKSSALDRTELFNEVCQEPVR